MLPKFGRNFEITEQTKLWTNQSLCQTRPSICFICISVWWEKINQFQASLPFELLRMKSLKRCIWKLSKNLHRKSPAKKFFVSPMKVGTRRDIAVTKWIHAFQMMDERLFEIQPMRIGTVEEFNNGQNWSALGTNLRSWKNSFRKILKGFWNGRRKDRFWSNYYIISKFQKKCLELLNSK